MGKPILRTTRTRRPSPEADTEIGDLKRVIKVQNVTIATSGGATDRTSVNLQNMGIDKWVVSDVRLVARTAAGTLATAQVGIYTAAAAGGTAIVAPAALTSLTAANKIQTSTVAAHDVQTADSLFIRQTVDSGNAGTADVIIELWDLSDRG